MNSDESCIFDVTDGASEPVVDQGMPGTEDIQGGFEGSRLLKLDGVYHLFTTERAGLPGRERSYDRIRTRLAHWSSTDARHWKRLDTLYTANGVYTEIAEDHPASDRRGSLWSFIPVFNEAEDRWNGFYVAYTCNPHIDPVHCFGRIWRAVSSKPGRAGIGGPYTDVGVIIEPGLSTQAWEGRQGVQFFHPYAINGAWYGWMGGGFAFEGSERVRGVRGRWYVGLARAEALAGPWFRLGTDVNPVVSIHPAFVENPVVETLPDGTLISLFDGGPGQMGFANQFGYSLSRDGVRWTPATYLRLDPVITPWWETMRTPLGLVAEGDGLYTIVFTAWKPNGRFHPIGMVKVRLSLDRLAAATRHLVPATA